MKFQLNLRHIQGTYKLYVYLSKAYNKTYLREIFGKFETHEVYPGKVKGISKHNLALQHSYIRQI